MQAKQGDTRQAQRCRRAVQVSATTAEAPVEVQKVSQDGYEVRQESLSESRRRLVVTAPAKQCQKAWRKMIKEARKTVKTPGFRDMKSVHLCSIAAVSSLDNLKVIISGQQFLSLFRFLRPLCYHFWGVS